MLKVNTLVSVINKDPTSYSEMDKNKSALPSYPFSVMSSHIPWSSPTPHSYPIISTAKDVDHFYNNESYNPISYTRNVNKVSIVPPKGENAYNVLQAVPFDDSHTTPPRSLGKAELGYENQVSELEWLYDICYMADACCISES